MTDRTRPALHQPAPPRSPMHTSLTGPTRATAEEEELEDQKAAITHLGHELRALVEATVRTAASPDILHRVADGVRAITSQLTGPAAAAGGDPRGGRRTVDGLVGHCT